MKHTKQLGFSVQLLPFERLAIAMLTWEGPLLLPRLCRLASTGLPAQALVPEWVKGEAADPQPQAGLGAMFFFFFLGGGGVVLWGEDERCKKHRTNFDACSTCAFACLEHKLSHERR